MQEIEKKVVEHDHEIKVINKRLLNLEKVADNIGKMAISIEKHTLYIEQILEEQKSQRDDIQSLKDKPSKKAEKISEKVITTIVSVILGAIIGALIGLVI